VLVSEPHNEAGVEASDAFLGVTQLTTHDARRTELAVDAVMGVIVDPEERSARFDQAAQLRGKSAVEIASLIERLK
jgi:hypothetical protein